MTPARIQELRALLAKATPGPLRVQHGHATFGDGTRVAYVVVDVPDPTKVVAYEVPIEDANLFAAAPVAIAELLSEVERLRGLLTSAVTLGRNFADRSLAEGHKVRVGALDLAASVNAQWRADAAGRETDALNEARRLTARVAELEALCSEIGAIGVELTIIAIDLVNGRAPSISTSEMIRSRADRLDAIRAALAKEGK